MGECQRLSPGKAKLFKAFGTYCGFSPKYFIRADRRPPIPGGWDITVEDFEPETRIIPLNVDKEGNVNRFVLKMVEEFRKEGLGMELADNGTILTAICSGTCPLRAIRN